MRRWQRELIDEMRSGRRELIDEMRRDNDRALREHERWRTEWRAQVDADRAQADADRARVDADRVEQKRRFDAIDAAMENDKRVTREMILELRQQASMLRDMQHGIRANTDGLLRVLDEFRRGDGGPSAAGA